MSADTAKHNYKPEEKTYLYDTTASGGTFIIP